MADANDQEARNLLAQVYTRMALEQENGIWRAQYLTAAKELREGIGDQRIASLERMGILQILPTATLIEMQAVRLDPVKVADGSAEIDFVLPDSSERLRVTVRNQVQTYEPDPTGEPADATVTLNKMQLAMLIFTQKVPPGARIDGSREAVEAYASWFTAPKSDFPIVWRP